LDRKFVCANPASVFSLENLGKALAAMQMPAPKFDDDGENGMAAKTNRARAGAALKPSKLFEGARPRPARPHGEAERAYFEQKSSRS
jgi:hypothetical protein